MTTETQETAQGSTPVIPSTYRQNLSLSKEEKDQKAVDFKVRRALTHVDSDILRTEESLADAQERLAKAESADPFSMQAVINAELDVENITTVLARANKIKARLFPTT
jgi:hypothetical protein